MTKKIYLCIALLLPLLGNQAFAVNSQQNKMVTCNKEASGKTGDERKVFMKNCLSAKAAAAPTQQEKMKTCNASATGKKGDERKAFMKQCLSSRS